MKTNTIYWLVLKFLLVSSLIKGQANGFSEADSLFAQASYERAATAYERIYFFSPDGVRKVTALLGRSYSLKKAGLYYEAYRSLSRVENFELSDSIKCVAYYELALNLYLSSYFKDAERYCAKAASIPVNSKEYKAAVLLHGFVCNELNDYSAARRWMEDYCNLSVQSAAARDSLLSFVNDYYKAEKLPKLKSLKKARRLSKILPGAGLFYAGEPGKAFANIGFQIIALGYTAANVYVTNYITAASAGLFLMRSFYTGGVNQLNEIVPRKNYYKSKQFNDNFKSSFIQKLTRYHAL